MIIQIKKQKYSFNEKIPKTTIKTFKKQIQHKPLIHTFNQIYGKITNPEEKKHRQLINAIIKAKNNPINKNKKVIPVKLNDRTIKLKPLLFK